jgi:subtilisin
VQPSRDGALPAFPELAYTILEVRFAPGALNSVAELSDVALVEAIRQAGGVAIIGLKPPAAQHTRVSRVLPGMSRTEALAGRQAIAARRGVELLRSFRYSSAVVARIPPDMAPDLRRLPFVNFVEPEGYAVPASSQGIDWGVTKVGADWVWANYGVSGQGAAITIIDTGIDSLHRLTPGLDGPAGQNAFGDCLYVTGIASSCYQDPNPDVGVHGSHIAGIISARDNEVGYVGIAPQPGSFASVRACGWVNGNWACPYSAIAAALDWVTSLPLNRQIVNISLQACDDNTELRAAIQRAAGAGVLIVAAAGNINRSCPGNPTGVLYPARYPEVIAVSGTGPLDQFAQYPYQCVTSTDGSRYGPEVELSAPFEATSMIADGIWASKCGTSQAAPVVTAVAALVWTAHPTWSAEEVRQRLASTAVDRGSPGRDALFGFGRVSAYWAFEASPTPPPPATAVIAGPSDVPLSATCSWSVVITPMAEPLLYEWLVNGEPAGSNSPTLTLGTGTAAFTIAVWIHDALGRHTYGDHAVMVHQGAPACNDQ